MVSVGAGVSFKQNFALRAPCICSPYVSAFFSGQRKPQSSPDWSCGVDKFTFHIFEHFSKELKFVIFYSLKTIVSHFIKFFLCYFSGPTHVFLGLEKKAISQLQQREAGSVHQTIRF